MNIIAALKSILKYKTFLLGTILIAGSTFFFSSPVIHGVGATTSLEKHSPLPAAFQHFKEDSDLMHNYLSKIKEAELHFYWTTGRTLSDNPAYHPDTNVEIGGAQYGRKFFLYVDKLLENAPANLTVKLVCDKTTKVSNAHEITMLHGKYGNRFKILSIDEVQDNLLKTFPSMASKINLLFKNATQGNPVIASDIYRVIGMPFDEGPPSDITQTLYAYCDIDEFCYGMENVSHTRLITALFNFIPQKPFYFGRSKENNDVIKLHVSDQGSYKDFCDRILDKVKANKPILTHFSKLHDKIKHCEQNPHECLIGDPLVEDPIDNVMLEVTLATGPKFLADKNITTDLSYPGTTVGAWSSPEEVLNYKLARYTYTHPPSVLGWGYGEASEEEKEAENAFIKDCEHYRKILSAAFYARRFGALHPFNKAIRNHLLNHFPYHTKSFINLLKLNFDFHHKDTKQDYTLDSMEGFSPEEEGHVEGKMYLKKNGGKLDYLIAEPHKKFSKGTLDINISEDLTRFVLRRYKGEILKKASENGHTREPKKGLSYEEWKKEAFQSITGSHINHYAALIRLLKEMGIDFPFTEASLDFKGQ